MGLAIIVLCICIYCCRSKAAQVQGNTSLLAATQDSSDYQKTLEPLFRKNCSPCHFPGGKMYERMPFDQDSTIIHHQGGIMKRISKADERKLINDYIEQNNN